MKRYGVPTVFAIFGVTGDLAQKKIFPALIDLYTKNLLPRKLAILGIARRDLQEEDFRAFVREAILKKKNYQEEVLNAFLENIQYLQGQFDDSETYLNTKKVLEQIDEGWGQCSNKLFYLSVPPSLYELILNNVSETELSKPCDDKSGWTRILIEKPFGKDTQTAQKLDALLGKLFKEEQIFRIDHYLKKQVLQNILAFRFSNSIFEPLWNRKYINAVEINLLEKETVGNRTSFYDSVGALRDVGQNHMLQMLALVAMEQPSSMKCSDVRESRENVFRKLRKYVRWDAKRYMIRGQYDGYEGLPETETFFSLVTYLKNKRWRDVPFYLTSGKGLNESRAEICVHFKDQTPGSFMGEDVNKLTFSIQPEEKISVLFWVKKTGFDNKVEPKELSFSFHEEEKQHIDAYEKVLFDCISGDQTSFISTNEILYTWDYIMSLKDVIERSPVLKYKIGSGVEDIKNLNTNLKKI